KKFGFSCTTTDTNGLLNDPDINTVIIITRHNTHASLTCQALDAGKHVFVEKPLCLTLEELLEIERCYNEAAKNGLLLMVGFNRRFSPHIQKIKELLASTREPKSFIMTINAGSIPEEHWIQDPRVGGGRIIGEACHFIDLLRFLAGTRISEATILGLEKGLGDTVSIQLKFKDGSIGTIHYFANGSKRFPKERLEVFVAGRILQLNNFRSLKGFGWPGFKKMNLLRQDKGQKECAAAFIKAIREGLPSPIPFDELVEVSRITIELSQAEGLI
ncbi:MAG: Gfo/Idh/MocA family oxidoreductase, partial [Chlorobi bacterium]|nr:Gfo/Idh/MocA family oxidoreductase [Chlorobiota bacterium]